MADQVAGGRDIWICLTCARCSAKCPYKVNYIEFIRGMREDARGAGNIPACSEGGLMNSLANLMIKEGIRQNRLGWLDKDMKVAQKGEYLLFTGCAPYLAVVFGEKDDRVLEGPRAAVRILNKLGITPVVSEQERCCGHDQYWGGDRATFEKLAKLNIAWIKSTGAKTVLATCPECFRTLLKDYKKVDPDFDLEVLHISEFLADQLEDGKLKFTKEVPLTVTYHDGCRLGRHVGVIEEPRMLLEKVPGLKVVEMEASGEETACCGVSALMNCDSTSKKLQLDRLKEAKSTGAAKMLAFCPKCRIHFKCARTGNLPFPKEEVDIDVVDFLDVLDRAM
jgi:Fe-S oxidoreductase